MEDKNFNKNGLLMASNTVAVQDLIDAIKGGVVTLKELEEHGLTPVRVKRIQDEFAKHEKTIWDAARDIARDKCKEWNTRVNALINYTNQYPNGKYINDAKELMASVDEECWKNAANKDDVSEQESCLNEYKILFPRGNHIKDCEEMFNDLPWVKTKQENTIQSYERYRKEHPDKHQQDVQQAITALTDEEDWQKAQAQKTNVTQAYKDYIQNHPHGNYVNKAKNIIDKRTYADKILEDLKIDKNSHDAEGIQNAVSQGYITYDDLEAIVGKDIIGVLKHFNGAQALTLATNVSDELQGGSTEVYLWGMTNSGKTCVLGSLLGYYDENFSLVAQNCKDRLYMDTLAGIFKSSSICVLPQSTSINIIAEMKVKIKEHTLSLIDIPGDLFQTVYRATNMTGGGINPVLPTLIKYLKDTRNYKIHFFIIEYSLNDKIRKINGISAASYLASMIQYLKDEGVLREKTTCLSVIVTKCDLIKEEDKLGEVERFLKKNYGQFMDQLKEIAKASGIRAVDIFAFSIGDVFFQNICKVNCEDARKIIDKMIEKSGRETTGFLKFLKS